MASTTNRYSLGEIADVRTGYTFRQKITEVAAGEGNAHVVQIKDVRRLVTASGCDAIAAEQLPEIKWRGREAAMVAAGAVLVPARGDYVHVSHLKHSPKPGLPVVVSSQFLVVTPKAGVLAEFLCWSLNQADIQCRLRDSCQGTNIAMLTVTGLKNVQLLIPPLASQQQLVELQTLWEKEQQLTKALLDNRERQIRCVFQKIIAPTQG